MPLSCSVEKIEAERAKQRMGQKGVPNGEVCSFEQSSQGLARDFAAKKGEKGFQPVISSNELNTESGQARDFAAHKVGLSPTTYYRALHRY